MSEETASGEDTRAGARTAAHRSPAFGTGVRGDNKDNGNSAVVRMTDRGPFVGGRIVDVSRIAARELGISGSAGVYPGILSIPEVDP